MVSSSMSRTVVLLTLAAVLLVATIMTTTGNMITYAHAAEEEDAAAAADTKHEEENKEPEIDMTNRKLAREAPKDNFDVKSHFEWGTYYDPKSIFCGKYDCYGILGFDYESFDKIKPDKKIITKRYRALSRYWHPDKSKHPEAKERFVKLARAYEVLTKEETRKEYDMMRYNQELYFQKYGSDVMFTFAPKSDTIIVLLFVLALINGFVYFAQYNRWKKVCDRLAKAATEDWNASQGGSSESKALRTKAMKVMEHENGEDTDGATINGTATSKSTTTSKHKTGGGGSSKSGGKLTSKEKKQLLNDTLRPFITKLAYEIEDFGAGFHKPTMKDLALIKMAIFPLHLVQGTVWQVLYLVRRIQKLPLSDAEKLVLTERAVGHVMWEFSSEDEKTQLVSKELWILKNLAEWNEEREFAKLSKSEQKQYKLMMKHQKQN